MGSFWSGFAVGFFVIPTAVAIAVCIFYWLKLKPALAKQKIDGGLSLPTPNVVSKKTEYTIELVNLHGNPFPFDHAKDKIVFLNFWATWCGPCVAEMPSIEKLYQKYAGRKDILFFIISAEEDTEKVKAFVEKNQYSMPVYFLQGKKPAEFVSRGIPATFIVGRDGTIVFEHVGAAQWDAENVFKYLDEQLREDG